MHLNEQKFETKLYQFSAFFVVAIFFVSNLFLELCYNFNFFHGSRS
jgi:hypothetical protein